MKRRKYRLSRRALAYWLCAIGFALVGWIAPEFVAVVVESEMRDDTYSVGQAVGGGVAYLTAMFVPWGLGLYFAGAGRRAQKTFNMRVMQERASEAKRDMLESVRGGNTPPPFFLYLRPFYADELLVDNPRVSSLPFLPSHYYESTVSWESVFADRLERHGRLVSLGTVSDSLSADRIESSDSTWVADFVLLASFAERIFIWPSARAGTRWEIRWLIEHDLMHKCVFVIADGYDQFSELCGDTWDYVRAFLLTLGVAPPRRRGFLFPADRNLGRVWRLTLSRWGSPRMFRELLSATWTTAMASRWELWRSAQAELEAAPPRWELDELDFILPCADCGRALDAIVCTACEQAAGLAPGDEEALGVMAGGESRIPAFNALGHMRWPAASV